MGVGVVVGVGVGVCVGVVPVQVVPFSVNVAGTGLEPLHEPLNPKLVLPFVPSEPLYGRLATETVEPLWVAVPFHSCVIFWPAVNVQPTFQELTGSPRLVTVTSAP